MTAEEHQWVNHKNKEKSEVSMLEWAHYFTALKLPPAHCRELGYSWGDYLRRFDRYLGDIFHT